MEEQGRQEEKHTFDIEMHDAERVKMVHSTEDLLDVVETLVQRESIHPSLLIHQHRGQTAVYRGAEPTRR